MLRKLTLAPERFFIYRNRSAELAETGYIEVIIYQRIDCLQETRHGFEIHVCRNLMGFLFSRLAHGYHHNHQDPEQRSHAGTSREFLS